MVKGGRSVFYSVPTKPWGERNAVFLQEFAWSKAALPKRLSVDRPPLFKYFDLGIGFYSVFSIFFWSMLVGDFWFEALKS